LAGGVGKLVDFLRDFFGFKLFLTICRLAENYLQLSANFPATFRNYL
jgi:hypothetical protein